MARYVVTGGAGFIGSHIVDALVERGDEVVVYDNLSTGRMEHIAHQQGRIAFIQGDLRDPAALGAAFKGADYVCHQAALGSVPRSVADPRTTNDVNITGTLNVLIAAREAGVKRVVYASSSSVYGDTPELPKHEGMRTNPLSPYALSKLAGEEYCRIFWRVYGLETIALRYFNVFGPRQDPASQYAAVIPRFIAAVLAHTPPTVYGDGTQSRDFTYVANVVRANLLAVEADRQAVGRAYNVAVGGETTLLALLEAIQKLLGSDIAPAFAPSRPGDVKHSRADYTAARAAFGYAPVVDFDEGLAQTVAFFAAKK